MQSIFFKVSKTHLKHDSNSIQNNKLVLTKILTGTSAASVIMSVT